MVRIQVTEVIYEEVKKEIKGEKLKNFRKDKALMRGVDEFKKTKLKKDKTYQTNDWVETYLVSVESGQETRERRRKENQELNDRVKQKIAKETKTATKKEAEGVKKEDADQKQKEYNARVSLMSVLPKEGKKWVVRGHSGTMYDVEITHKGDPSYGTITYEPCTKLKTMDNFQYFTPEEKEAFMNFIKFIELPNKAGAGKVKNYLLRSIK